MNKIQEEEEEEFTCSKDHAGVDPFIAETPSLFWVKVFMICSPSSLVRIGLLITVQNLPFVIHHILYNPCSLFSLRNVCTDQNQELDSRLVELFCSHESEAGFHFCLHRVTFQILGTSLTCSSVLTLIRTRAPSTMVVPAKALSFGFVDHNRSTTSSQY